MLVELLAGPLIGSAFIDNESFKKEWGTFVMVVDPELFVPANEFKAATSQLCDRIRLSRTAEGQVIRMPGEETRLQYEEAEMRGYVNIDSAIYDKVFAK